MIAPYRLNREQERMPADHQVLFETLTQSHAASNYTVALAILDDPVLARQVLVDTLADAWIRLEQTQEAPAAEWLVDRIWKRSRSLARQARQSRQLPPPENEIERKTAILTTSFDPQQRLLCALHYGLGWSDAQAARLLNVRPGAIRQQLNLFEQKLASGLTESAGAGQVPLADGETCSPAALAFRRRYAIPDWGAQEWADLIEQARRRADQQQPGKIAGSILDLIPRQFSAGLKWALLGGAGLLIVAICLFAGLFLALYPKNGGPSPSIIQQPRRLTWLSSPQSIRDRLIDSSSLWKTLWIDVQTTDYGPAGYIGAPRLYRAQAWIRQPDQSIQLFGLLSAEPSSAYIVSDGRITYFNPMLKQSTSQPVESTIFQPLLENKQLKQMVYPGSSSWTLRAGMFRVEDTDRILEMDVLVVNWYNAFGQREARLWIDPQTGLILRAQEFGGDQFELLLCDAIVTDIAFDQSFPPARLAESVQAVGSSSPLSESQTTQIIQPTPTPAIQPGKRPSPLIDPAPMGFDPASSQLVFRFPNNIEATNVQTGTAEVDVQLIAEGYKFGDTRFGLPWMLRCDRSPDGNRLAYNTGSDGTSVPDDSLRWLDLREPAKIYQPIRHLHADAFAFSPDSQQIAVFARGGQDNPTGLYLIDLAIAENQLVLALPQAEHLLWSPDGETLALVGKLSESETAHVILIHLRTSQIAFQAPLPAPGAPLPTDWPISAWGLPFPPAEQGLEACAILDSK